MGDRLLRRTHHNLSIGPEQVIPAHSRLAGKTRRNHHNVGASRIFIVRGTEDGAIVPLQPACLHQIQRHPLRPTGGNI